MSITIVEVKIIIKIIKSYNLVKSGKFSDKHKRIKNLSENKNHLSAGMSSYAHLIHILKFLYKICTSF